MALAVPFAAVAFTDLQRVPNEHSFRIFHPQELLNVQQHFVPRKKVLGILWKLQPQFGEEISRLSCVYVQRHYLSSPSFHFP